MKERTAGRISACNERWMNMARQLAFHLPGLLILTLLLRSLIMR